MALGGLAAAIVVSSHDRPVRLRWLLNALAEQTVSADRFEVIVAHDSSSPETERLLLAHPLRATGQLRHLSFAPGSVLPGAKRDAGWRAARARLILFTDDDCRPSPDWVAQALAAAEAHPGVILQGMTAPDPEEAEVLRGAPWAHTVLVVPPTPWAETCNIVYPRSVLERVGGLDPDLRVGEDTDLALRAQAAGVKIVAAPQLRVYHAVTDRGLLSALRSLGRWQHIAWLVKRHPHLRSSLWGGIWWKREHAALICALGSGVMVRRSALAGSLALPWLALALRHRGFGARGMVRSVLELPGRAAIDATEIFTLARGSIRYRTLLL